MTTQITITNTSNKDFGDHIVLVKRDGQVIHKLYPGEQTQSLYVWNHSPLTIEEEPLKS